ncbi:hypothetical protein ACFWVM_28985 [Nocardia fluminea]|uniref:hypothetical protein n=1 Tax=Nocardia fluminea TaxID=134984 RepID=UPI00366793BB
MAQLNTFVAVRNPDSGIDHWFGPGVDLPVWAIAKITNPAAYAVGGPTDAEPIQEPAAEPITEAEPDEPVEKPVRRTRKAAGA